MDVKKAIIAILGIIIVVGLGVLVYNLIFNGDLLSTAFKGVGSYINDFWKTLTGPHGGDIFDPDSVTAASGTTIAW